MNLIWLIRDGSLLLNESKEWSQGDNSQAAYLPPGLPLFILFSANPLLLGSLSATLLLEDQNTKRQFFFFFFLLRDLFQHIWDWVLSMKSYNSFFESDELLLLLLPALKVSVDQRLQLIKVFVLTFLLDVLLEVVRRQISLTYRINVVASQPTCINTQLSWQI